MGSILFLIQNLSFHLIHFNFKKRFLKEEQALLSKFTKTSILICLKGFFVGAL